LFAVADPPPAPAPGDRFDEFWAVYPRRIGKAAARRKWDVAVRSTSPAVIIDGARAYAATRAGTDPQYIAHPTTWLNQGRWEDEHLEPDETGIPPWERRSGTL
jgi:hypothetical protein